MQQRIVALNATDQVYYTAFKALAAENSRRVFIQTCKSLSMLLLLIYFLNIEDIDQIYTSVSPLLIFNLCCCVYSVLFYLIMAATKYNNVGIYLAIALKTNHCIEGQLIVNPSKIDYCVSHRTYLNENPISRGQMTEAGHALIVGLTKNTIIALIKMTFKWVKLMENSSALLSVGSMVWSIVVLSTTPLDTQPTIILSLYVTIVGLTNMSLLVVLLLIALSPILCIGFICCCCCGGGKNGARQYINLPSRQATTNDIINLGGDCPICHMSVDLNSKIYVLPCSQKHIFHTYCLNQWARVKNTCPQCREVIPMTAQGRESQVIE